MTIDQTTPLTDEQLNQIETRANAATAGPWGVYEYGGGNLIEIAADLEETGHGYRARREICRLEDEPLDNDPTHKEWTAEEDWAQVQADAEFISHAPEDVRALLATVRRLRDALAREERLHGDTIDDRDRAQDAADKLAYAVASEEVIGEHTADNCPWTNALDLITPKVEADRLRAETSAVTAIEKAFAAELNDDRALTLLDALIVLRSKMPCTCARSQGLHERGCRRYVPGHELLSPARRLARGREELRLASAPDAPAV